MTKDKNTKVAKASIKIKTTKFLLFTLVATLLMILYISFFAVATNAQGVNNEIGVSESLVWDFARIAYEEPFNIELYPSTVEINKTEKSLTIDGRFWTDEENVSIPSATKYLGFSFGALLNDGDLWYRNYGSNDVPVHLGKTDFKYLSSYKGYNRVYYTTFANIPSGTDKEFRLKFYFAESPKTFIMYFGTASTVVSVTTNSLYRIVGGTNSNGLPIYAINVSKTAGSMARENNMDIYNQNFPSNAQNMNIRISNSTSSTTSNQVLADFAMSNWVVESGPIRAMVHFENASSSYGNYANCTNPYGDLSVGVGEVICFNYTTDYYAYPTYYQTIYFVAGNFSKIDFPAAVSGTALQYVFTRAATTSPKLDSYGAYNLDGYISAASTDADANYNISNNTDALVFVFNTSGTNRTFASFIPIQTWAGTAGKAGINTTYRRASNYTRIVFVGMGGLKTQKNVTFSYASLFGQNGNTAVTSNDTIYNLDFKNAFLSFKNPATVTAFTGSYEGFSNITGTYNLTQSGNTVRFNFTTGLYNRTQPVFFIKDLYNASATINHVWWRNYTANSAWQQLTNWTNFLIQGGNSTYFGYDYILFMPNYTLYNDSQTYEFWISNSTNPVVGTSTTADAIAYSNQRNTFYAAGLFWVFYSNGTRIVYKTSSDGLNWSAITDVRAGTSDSPFAVRYDGTYLHYAFGYSSINQALFYRRGTPNSDGTITWSAAEQTVQASSASNSYGYPDVYPDSNGYPFIIYRYGNNTGSYWPFVIKSDNNDGTWSGSETAVQLNTTNGNSWNVRIFSVGNGHMVAIYAFDITCLKTWNGATWGTEVKTSNRIQAGSYGSGVSDGSDTIHYVFLSPSPYNIVYTNFSYSGNDWSDESTIDAAESSTSAPVLTRDTITGKLYCFWFNGGSMYYRIKNGTWTNAVAWINDTPSTNARLSSFEIVQNNKTGVAYAAGTASPYNVMFAYLNALADTIAPLYSNNASQLVATYDSAGYSNFSTTWTDDSGMINGSYLENNFTGTLQNTSMSGSYPTYTYNSSSLAAATYQFRFVANDSSNNQNATELQYFTIAKAKPVLIMNNATATVNTSGLVGYWRFENESLGYATDYSGYNNTGNLTKMNNSGNATSGPTAAGRFGSAMQFDGTNDIITISDSDNWNFSSRDFAIDFWVKLNSLPANGAGYAVFSQRVDMDNRQRLYFYNDNGVYNWQYDVSSGGSLVISLSKATTISTNTWYHIVLNRNGTSFRIFQNGVQVGLTTTDSDAIPDLAANVVIGETGSDWYFNGTLDEYHIWNRSLSLDEINELYASTKPYGQTTTLTLTEQNSGDTDVGYSLFWNTTNVTTAHNGTAVQLPAGYHYYLANTSGGQNYTQSTLLLPVNIAQNTSTANYMNLTINGTESNKTYTYPSVSNATGWFSSASFTGGLPTFTLYRYDNTSIGASNPQEDVQTLPNGTHWYIYNTSGNANYSSSSKSFYIVINKATPTITLTLDGSSSASQSRTYPNTTSFALSESNSGDGGCTYDIKENGTSQSSTSYTKQLAARSYNITAYTAGCENYTATQTEIMLTVNQNSTNPVNIYLINSTGTYANQNITVTYGGQSTANATIVYSGAGTASLYEDGASVSNPRTAITLSAGLHSYKGNTSGNENYTTNATGATYYINVTGLITVCQSGGCDYTNIQGGINSAPNGYTVMITDSSIYNENVTLNKSITLTSNSTTKPSINSTGTSLLINANSAAVTNLNIYFNGSTSSQHTVWIKGNGTTVANNTIGKRSQYSNYPVYIQNSANNTIYGNNVTSQSTTSHAIYITGSVSTNNTIDSNLISYPALSSAGIFIFSTNNNTARNNNITSVGGYMPIIITPYGNTIVIENNYVNGKPIVYNKSLQNTTITATDYGELILANCSNVTVNNSQFTEAGILFTKTTNSTVSNSNITTKTEGILFNDASNYTTILNNNITTTGSSYSPGIRLADGYYNNITGNNITTTSSSTLNYGIFMSASTADNETISSNRITTLGSSSVGIRIISGSDNHKITNTNITTSGNAARGIYIVGDNTNISSCNITTTGTSTNTIDTSDIDDQIPSPIHISGGNNNRISDCILNATNYYDVFLTGTGNEVNYIINSSLNKSDIRFNASSNTKLYNQYYLDVYVNDSSGSAIESATVFGNDTDSVANIENPTSNFTDTTNSSGYTTQQILNEFVGNWTYNMTNGYMYFTNYTVNASKAGYNNANAQVNLTSSTLLVLTLTTDTTPPLWGNQTTNDTDNTINQGEWINLTAQGYDETALDWAWLETNESGVWRNYTNSSWRYRKAHNITGSTAGAQTNYTINITIYNTTGTDSGSEVYVGTKARTDFGDVRFTNSTGDLLDYWVERLGTNNATFWVEIPSISASPNNATIYIYYGNPSATNVSNISNTFYLPSDSFDRLNSASVGNWWVDWDYSVATVNITDNTLMVDNPGFGSCANIAKACTNQTSLVIPSNFSLTFKIRLNKEDYYTTDYGVHLYNVSGGGSTEQMFVRVTNNGVATNSIQFAPANSTQGVCNTSSNVISADVDSTLNYNLVEIRVNGSSTASNAYIYYNDSLLLQAYMNCSLDPNLSVKLGQNDGACGTGGSARTSSANFDWIRIRNYASPEPSHGGWGSEETFTYGSPMDMGNAAATWTWSNFTWSNSSVAQCTVVGWKIYYNDTKGNQNVTDRMNFTIRDTTPPKYSNNASQLATTYNPTGYSNFSVTWSDSCGFNNSYIEHNFTGTLQNTTMSGSYPTYTYNSSSLAASTYQFRFVANDSSNNQNATEWRYFTIAKADPAASMILALDGSSTESQTRNYPNTTRFLLSESNSGDGGCSYDIKEDGTSQGSTDYTKQLAARSYNITGYTDICTNYTAAQTEITLTVTQISPTIAITLTNNNTDYGSTDTAQCSITTGDSSATLTLYRNGSNVASGTTPISESTVLPAGYWNYTCTYDQSENYTATNTASWMLINKAKPVLVMSNATASVNTSRLVGYWRLEEGSGTKAYDSSGWSSTGTLANLSTGYVVWQNNCVFGTCLNFFTPSRSSGSKGGYVTSTIQNSSTNMTLMAWFNTGYDFGVIVALDRGGSGINSASLTVQLNTGKVCYTTYLSYNPTVGNNNVTICSSNAYNDSLWHFAAVSINSSGESLYVDGTQVASSSTFSNISDFRTTYIGIGNGAYGFFNGTIDEPRVWNRSLSANEIKELYESRVTYGTQTTFTLTEQNSGDIDVGYNLFWNTTNVTTTHNGTPVQLPAGYHYYLANTSGGQNYTQSAILLPVNITQNTSTANYMNLTINGTESNKTYTYPAVSNATGWFSSSSFVSSAPTFTLYRYDNTSIGTSNPQEDVQTLPNGTHWYIYNTSGNQNYSSASKSYYVFINKGTPSIAITLTNNNTDYGLTGTAQCSITTGDGSAALTLYRNGTNVASGTTPIQESTVLPAGYWNYTCTYDQSQNYSSTTTTSWMLINKAKPVLIMNNATASVNTSGLVGYWRFDEGTGTAAYDSSGWNNTGSITSGTPWVSGKYGSALDFNSGGRYVTIGNHSEHNFDGSSDFAIAAWVNSSTITDWPAIFDKGAGQSTRTGYRFELDKTSQNIYFFICNGTDRWSATSGTSLLNDSRWHLIVGVFDKTGKLGAANRMYLFYDGVMKGNNSVSNLVGSISNASKILTLGSSSARLNGSLDEIQIWNRSLAADEIKELYESRVTYGTQTNFTLSESNSGDSDVYYDFFRNSSVAGVWHLDEGSGSAYAFDDTGNNNTGTLTNMNVTGNATSGWTTDCKFGSCLKFDGVNDYVLVPASSIIKPTDALTLEVSFKPNKLVNEQTLISIEDWAGKKGYYMYISYGVGLRLGNGTNFYYCTNSSYSITEGNWYTLVLTWDGTMMRFYLNGTQIDATEFIGLTYSSGVNLRIGSEVTDEYYFNGTIDEVRIYPRALSAAEILCHYGNNCSAAGFNNETATLPAGYHYYVGRASEGANYTTSALLLPLNITPATNAATLTLSPSSPTTYGTQTTVTCSATYGTANLYRNDTLVNSEKSVAVTLSAGNWSYVCNVSATANYSSASSSAYYMVQKAKPVLIMNNATASVNTSGLVGYWRFEEGGNSNFTIDYSGWNNTAYLNNMNQSGNNMNGSIPSGWTTGRFGNALGFDGGNDYVNISNSPSLNPTQAITVSLWIKWNNNTNQYQHPIIKGTSNGPGGYDIFVTRDGGNPFAKLNVSGTSQQQNFNQPLSIGTWTYIAFTYDGSIIRTYFNGVPGGTLSVSGSISTTSDDLRIGNGGSSSLYFNGTIDEVRIWNRSLTADEIKELYASTKPYGQTTTFTLTEQNTGDADVGYNLFWNTTNVTTTHNGAAIQLPAGYHYYLANTSGGQNYTQSSLLLPVNITQNTSTANYMNLTINGTESNKTYTYPAVSNTTGYFSSSSFSGGLPTFTLYRYDNTSIGTSNPQSDVQTLPNGTHWYVYNTSGTQNYSATSKSFYIVIDKGTPAISISLTNNNTDYGLTDTAQCSITTGDSSATLTLYRNGSNVASGTTPIQEQTVLPAGYWNYTCTYDASENYTSTSTTSWMLINKAKPTLIMNNATATVNTSGLVGYWRFEEGSGATASDSSGNGNTGTINKLNNGVYWTTNGKFGNALRFDNITSNLYVDVGNNPVLYPTSALTVEVWVKLNASRPSESTPFVVSSASQGSYSLYQDWDADNRITFYLKNSTGSQMWASVTGADVIPLNTWLHIVGTYDSSTHTLKIYVNGVLQTACTTCILGPLATAIDSIQLGNENLNGTIDEVQIWNRSLTADEVKELYASTKPYGQATTFTLTEQNSGDADVGYNLFWNTTNVTTTHNDTSVQLPAGYHYYLANTSGGQNYTQSAILLPVNITQNTSTANYMNLTINGTESNKTYTYPAVTNATGWFSSSSFTGGLPTFTLYRYDNTSIGTSNPQSDVQTLPNGTHWYVYNTSGTQNYSAASKTFYIKINKAPTSMTLYLNGSAWASDTTKEYPNATNVNATINVSSLQSSVVLQLNGSNTNNPNVTLLPLGVWNYTAYYTEAQNYTGSSAERLITIVDTRAPAVSLVSPVDYYNSSDGTPDFTFSVTDAADSSLNCVLYLNDTNKGDNAATPTGQSVTITSSSLSNGLYNWYINCTDDSGNKGKSAVRTIRIDITIPSYVSIILGDETGGDSEYDNDGTVAASLGNADMESDIAYCNISWDNSATWSYISPSTTSTTHAYATDGSNDGLKTVRYNCTDFAGNMNSTSDTITLDTQAPTKPGSFNVKSTNTSDPTGWSTSGSVNLTWTAASDVTTSVAKYAVWRSCVNETPRNVETCPGGLSNYTNIFNTTQLNYTDTGRFSNTTYSYNVSAVDVVDHTNTTTNISIRIDTDKPGVTITAPAENYMTNSTSIAISADYMNTYLVNCNATHNATTTWYEMSGDNAVSGTATYTFNSLTDNHYTFTVRCWDQANNTQQDTVVAIVDTVHPFVSIYLGDNEGQSSEYDNDRQVWATLSNNDPSPSSGHTCKINWDGTWESIATSLTSISHTYTSDGAKTVYYNCSDGAGNWNMTSDTITVDTGVIGVTINLPSLNQAMRTGSTLTVNASVADTVEPYVQNGATCNVTIGGSDCSGSVTYSSATGECYGTCTVPSVSEGTKVFNISVADPADNIGSAVRNVVVDNSAPTFSNPIESPTDPATYSSGAVYQFNITVADTYSSLSTVLIEFNGVNYTADSIGSVYNKTFVDLAANTAGYSYKWYASDSAGNWNNSSTYTYTINKVATTINLLLNGTDVNKIYARDDVVNMSASLSISEKTVNIDTNFTGTNALWKSGTTPLENLTGLDYNPGLYNVTTYFGGNQNYSSSSETHYIDLGVRLTFNLTSASSPVQQLYNTKFYVMDTGKAYTNFSYQKKYGITSSSQPQISYVFTQTDSREGRDVRLELPTDMGMMTVEIYNVTPNSTKGGIVSIRLIDGKNYTGPNPITGELSYIFFINDTLLNYSSYNIKVPFNRTRMSSPNKFLRCLEFNWTSNICTRWNVTDTSSMAGAESNYTFEAKKASLKCSPALADTAMHGASYYEMYGGMSSNFSKLYFDDFEFGYGDWQAQNNVTAYPYPSESYSGSTATGYSLKVEYLGGAGSTTKTSCENWEVQSLCSQTGSNTSGCTSDWYADNEQDDVARAAANSSFVGNCSLCCGGSGTFVPYSSSPYRDPWNTTETPYRYHAYGECICTAGTAGGYVAKTVDYNTKQYKFITFSYKASSTSKLDMKVLSNGTWFTYNGTATQGNFSISGFQADDMWHTATISLDRDLDNITQCTGACTHQVTQIKFGSDSGQAGQRFFIDDFAVINEMGAASKTLYQSDFEKYCQISEWYNGQQGTMGQASTYSLKIPMSVYVMKYVSYFTQDYKYVDFAYKTGFGGQSVFSMRVMSYKSQGGYYTNWNMTEINVSSSNTGWTTNHINLADYGLSDTKVEKIEFYSTPGEVWVDNFVVSNDAPGECTNCNITVGSTQFNTKYFSDFEYGTGGWVAAGCTVMTVKLTNETSYSGSSSLMITNCTTLVANFTPSYSAPSVSTSVYPYMSFAYKAALGTIQYRINNATWYKIANFTADNIWHTVTIDLRNWGAQVNSISIGNQSAETNAIFYIDDFVIASNRPENCPYQDVRHDIMFNMMTSAGWRIDAGSGQALPDLYVVEYTLNNTTAIQYNDFILVNVTVGNIGNASTGGGNDAIQVDLYLDDVLQSTNYTHELPAHPPRNESWVWVNFTAPGAGLHTINITSMLNPPPGKDEWNYTNNNISIGIVIYSGTKITPVLVNTTTPIRGSGSGGGLNVTARLLFANNSAIPEQTLNFTDTNTSTLMNSAITNSNGYAEISYAFPSTAALGPHKINVTYSTNSTMYTYTSNNDTVSVNVYSTANVSFNTASGQTVQKGQSKILEAIVKDSINGSAIGGYPCRFYDNTTLLYTNVTNSTGDCIYKWDTSGVTGGLRTVQVNITNNATIYYFADSLKDVSSISLTINSQPTATVPVYNVTPAEIERGNGIEISCNVSDAEDTDVDTLTVNISVKDTALGTWSNVTTTTRIGNTFYRNYQTTQSSLLGNYTAVCSVADTNGGYTENSSLFLVWQNGTVSVNLNASSVGYAVGINVSGQARYLDTGYITSSSAAVYVDGEAACADTTDTAGAYDCQFVAPNKVGVFRVSVEVTDKDTGKIITNSTSLTVSVTYGEEKKAEEVVANVGCYEVPMLVQNQDGSITKSTVRICVWK